MWLNFVQFFAKRVDPRAGPPGLFSGFFTRAGLGHYPNSARDSLGPGRFETDFFIPGLDRLGQARGRLELLQASPLQDRPEFG